MPNNTVNNAPTNMLMYTGIPMIEATIAARVIPVDSSGLADINWLVARVRLDNDKVCALLDRLDLLRCADHR